MKKIENFQHIRSDGTVLDPQITPEQIEATGWRPLKIIRIQWESEGRTFRIDDSSGLLADLLPGGVGITVQSDKGRNLSVINPDGSLRFKIPTTQTINGTPREGRFCGSDSPRSKFPDRFAVLFETLPDYHRWVLEIDALTGKTVDSWWTK